MYIRQIMGSIRTQRNEIFNIFISLLWCRGKERRLVPPLNTQCFQNSAEWGEWSVLTLGSLCLLCYMRNTEWSWMKKKHTWYYSCRVHERQLLYRGAMRQFLRDLCTTPTWEESIHPVRKYIELKFINIFL